MPRSTGFFCGCRFGICAGERKRVLSLEAEKGPKRPLFVDGNEAMLTSTGFSASRRSRAGQLCWPGGAQSAPQKQPGGPNRMHSVWTACCFFSARELARRPSRSRRTQVCFSSPASSPGWVQGPGGPWFGVWGRTAPKGPPCREARTSAQRNRAGLWPKEPAKVFSMDRQRFPFPAITSTARNDGAMIRRFGLPRTVFFWQMEGGMGPRDFRLFSRGLACAQGERAAGFGFFPGGRVVTGAKI